MSADQLPKKRMAAGAVVCDAMGQLLIVKPTYRMEWLVPGGIVELDESPRVALAREITEELGLQLVIGRLLCVDYRPPEPHKSESVHFIFDAGVLSTEQNEQILLPSSELERYIFLMSNDALPMLDIHLQRRMTHALIALRDGSTLYLEDGCIPV
jgi:8-oxo-dGTP pyrophosphatase MutT (NUDIX family)